MRQDSLPVCYRNPSPLLCRKLCGGEGAGNPFWKVALGWKEPPQSTLGTLGAQMKRA